ncbi:putative quinol monooxygenase [Mycolicibacterium grossiae]|uniref:ABM domain-containing protein n=1 Tax=Mycolicibacterium grossiae TaxID=1552759 RepID=A0A1E8Q7Q6_9MYCO|nr:putative quinol monooxygenase [Mycolicibacterium grossiae]OFJ54059.1 hypothetical protein BEL07_09380 [Mycolicibacterium grossiae]QEM44242.1 antibiotic biosynthesis monooxygenase [Mycolicibacterium grossiae]
MTAPVVVVARWDVRPDALDAVLGWIADLAPRARAEPGCRGYEVLVSAEDPATLILIERYADRAALDAHLTSPHYAEFVVDRIRPCLTDRRVEILTPREC